MYQSQDYPRIFLTADIVLFSCGSTFQKPDHVLLIQRKNDPFKDCWALPGGFFDLQDQTIYDAAARELLEETSLSIPSPQLRLVGVFSKKNRDPREANAVEPCRIVSATFTATVNMNKVKVKAQDDAKELKFFELSHLPKLAFDHVDMIKAALLMPERIT